MKPARIVFPGFWFGQSTLKEAQSLARRGVGGFCLYDEYGKKVAGNPYGYLQPFCIREETALC